MTAAASTMRKAAALLLVDAEAEEGSCSVGDKLWACPDCQRDAGGKCQAQRNVEDRRKTAAKLFLLAKAAA